MSSKEENDMELEVEYEQSTSRVSLYQGRLSEVTRQSLDHLLAMAQRYRSEGDLRQAADIWWTLLQEHSETPQAQAAQDKLLELAHVYEREGFRHQARAFYQRLL
jgi:lipopolysaccharide biosynthesis regulator YciM